MKLQQRSQPVLRRPRKLAEKPPLPTILEPVAEKAKARQKARGLSNPGVSVDVEKVTEHGYRITSPHNDLESWEAMVQEAFGTRSRSTAKTFLNQLSRLCTQLYIPNDNGVGGEWCPDETELNMIVNMVGSIAPRNELQAALAAQAVAAYLMSMKASEIVLRNPGHVDAQTAATAGKLMRTSVMLSDAIARAKGKKTSRQTIKVSHEKHIHQHVHVAPGGQDRLGQPHGTGGTCEPSERTALPRPQPVGEIMRFPSNEGEEGLSVSRSSRRGSAR